MTRRAEFYLSLAKSALRLARTTEELGLWWSEEDWARREVGLTEEQEADLIAARDTHRDRILRVPPRQHPRGKR